MWHIYYRQTIRWPARPLNHLIRSDSIKVDKVTNPAGIHCCRWSHIRMHSAHTERETEGGDLHFLHRFNDHQYIIIIQCVLLCVVFRWVYLAIIRNTLRKRDDCNLTRSKVWFTWTRHTQSLSSFKRIPVLLVSVLCSNKCAFQTDKKRSKF